MGFERRVRDCQPLRQEDAVDAHDRVQHQAVPQGCAIPLSEGSAIPKSGAASVFDSLSESREGISPPRAPRTVLETLTSYGSRCSTVAIHQTPVSEKSWIGFSNSNQPLPCRFWSSSQELILTSRPLDQKGVYSK